MVLSKQHHVSMIELQQKLEKYYKVVLSTSQLYNIVKKLREAYILTKEHGAITLNKLRIRQINDYNDRVSLLHEYEYASREYLNQ